MTVVNDANGELTSKVSSIVKGEKGVPGEIKGSIVNSRTIGSVGMNTEFGIYGNLTNTSGLNIDTSNELEVATRDEIEIGKAKPSCVAC